ncbi:MAG: aldo/keto reductase [Ruminococcus sp.]|nr:aldo/keto reductase [Ruminococcus sp.]
MQYRKLPHGDEKIGVLGLGMGGGLHKESARNIQAVIEKAIENEINFYDLCASGNQIFEPFGKAIHGNREKLYFQMHFGAVFNENGEYEWTRDLEKIRHMIDWELKILNTDYIDFGYLHCVDEISDYNDLVNAGVLDYIQKLKSRGIVRHIGLSSHTPSVAQHIIDTGLIDMMMFSINVAYDYEKGDEYGIGTVSERAELFRRCEKEGVGISVMKPFHGGQLLDEKTSPFRTALTRNQCLQYVLDRPAVLTAVPGIRNMSDLNDLLDFINADESEKDYSVIGNFTADKISGNCVYCNHCQPCPAGIQIGLVNKYYDLARIGDKLAEEHYRKLDIKASACMNCGHCDERCPFGVEQSSRMNDIQKYFNE